MQGIFLYFASDASTYTTGAGELGPSFTLFITWYAESTRICRYFSRRCVCSSHCAYQSYNAYILSSQVDTPCLKHFLRYPFGKPFEPQRPAYSSSPSRCALSL